MEKRDLYDIERNLTGETINKDDPIPENRYISVVLIFIQNSRGEFLIQKRTKEKNGKYATTGGHTKSGQTAIQGIISEVKEELGCALNEKDIIHFFGGRSDEERVFWDDFYVKMDIENIEVLSLQKEEVESVHWFTIDEIEMLYNEEKFFKNHYEEFEILLYWLEKKEKEKEIESIKESKENNL